MSKSEDKTWYAGPNKAKFITSRIIFNNDEWIMPDDLHDCFWGYKNNGIPKDNGSGLFDECEEDYLKEESDV